MLETPAAFHARVLAATDDERRLPVDTEEMAGWDIYPFEVDSLRHKPLRDPEPEPPRRGEDPTTCWCAAPVGDGPNLLWSDDRWRLTWAQETQLPIELFLVPREHCDLPTVPDDLAAEMGRLIVAISAAVESLPSVGRCQLAKYGDGGAHLHLFFLGRPAEMLQLRGSPLLDWAGSMPVVPLEVLEANARHVASEITRRYGGSPALS